MESFIGSERRVARVMPNTPALLGQGAGGFTLGKNCTPVDAQDVKTLATAVGISFEVRQELLDSVTGLSGSGPAYVFMFIEALADAGVKQGLPRKLALQMAAQSVYGASKMALESGKHPEELKDEVCEPGGPVMAAVTKLEELKFRGAAMAAV